jgi:hypothetical protein
LFLGSGFKEAFSCSGFTSPLSFVAFALGLISGYLSWMINFTADQTKFNVIPSCNAHIWDALYAQSHLFDSCAVKSTF